MEFRQIKFLKHLWSRKRHVYLDYNATTNVSGRVRRTMNHVLKHNYGNPSALYGMARKSAEVLEAARQRVAAAIHADAQEIYFTGCATESNNAVLKSLSDHFYPKKKKIISLPIEHPSVLNTLEYLQTRGIVVDYSPVDSQGRALLDELEKRIDGDTFLVCCMLANNEIGTIQDIRAVSAIAGRHGVLVLSDCVQALGKIPIDVHDWGIDYASFSAHKLYGPKGVGALYVKQGSPFAPLLHGGHQESNMRAGTEGIHNIAGFGAACLDVDELLAHEEQVRALKERLIRQLREIAPDCVVNSPAAGGLANTISVTFPNESHAGLMAFLDDHGIAVSAASACSAQEDKPSHVLKAIGRTDQAARETIRISLGCATSTRDIRCTVKTFRDFFRNRTAFITTITPAQLDKAALFDEQNYILDVRPQFQRRFLPSLPNSHEISFAAIEKHLLRLPKDKPIVVVCQNGHLSAVVAYYLKSMGFGSVGSLSGGVSGWKKRHDDLYQKYAGKNVVALKAEK
jgi:cysteine desulfurase